MSLSDTPSSSDKAKGRPGIFRIFKQSVKDLGRVPKSDFKHFKKESDALKQQTDNKSVCGKKETSPDDNHKEVKRFSTFKSRDKDCFVSEKEPNNNVGSFKRNDSKSSSYSKRRDHDFCRNEASSGFNDRSVLDENKNKRENRNEGDEIVNFKVATETVKNVFNLSVKDNNESEFSKGESEDWENDLVDLVVNEYNFKYQQDNLQNILGDRKDSNQSIVNSQSDFNNNYIQEVDYTETLESKTELETTLGYENLKEKKHTENTNECPKDLVKVVGCTDKEKAKRIEEYTSEKQSLPFHSTPKKSGSFHDLDKEFDTSCSFSNKSDNSFSPKIVKQIEEKVKADLNILTGSIDSDNCVTHEEGNGSDGPSKMRNFHNASRTFERGDGHCRNSPSKNLSERPRRNHVEYDMPPRFRDNRGSGDGDKLESADVSFRNARGNDSWHRPQKHRHLRNVNNSKHVEENVKHFDNQNRRQLLDLKIKTPVKFKAERSGFNRMNSACRNEVENNWEMPASEDWSSELLDLDAINADANAIPDDEIDDKSRRIPEEHCLELNEKEVVEKKVEVDNHVEQYFPPMPPNSALDVDILDQKETISEKLNAFEEDSGEKRFEFEHESLCQNVSGVEGSSVYSQEHEGDKDISSTLSTKELLTSNKPNVYLPPIPAEVLASGDEENWGKGENVNEIQIKPQGLEGIAEIFVTVQEEHTNKNSPCQYVESKKLHSENDVANKNMQGLSEDKATGENIENNFETIGHETKLDITNYERNINKKEVAEDSCSLSSIYANQEQVCVYSANDNMTSEADVSDLPLDENKCWENERSGGFCCEKADQESGNTVSAIANIGEKNTEYESSRDAYEQYVRYWYGQDAVTADYMQRGQLGQWHHNYPYDYEAYCRWYEQIQMTYYWDMYNRQMQYGGQDPYYWYGDSYSCQDESKMESCSAVNATEDKVIEQVESKNINKRLDRKKPSHHVRKDHSKQTDQLKTTASCLENAEELNLREYKCERMHQWVNNHSPEVISDKRPDLKEADLLSKNSLKESNQNLRKSEDTSSNGFHSGKINIPESVGISSVKVKEQKEKSKNVSDTEEKISDLNEGEKSEPSCTCKPSQVTFMVWRACACGAGNPTRLHKILCSGFDERSLDLGYQSIESLEHDESGVRQVGGKAPGFVIQPLCSTPATENKNIDLPKHKKVSKEKEKLAVCKSEGEKAVKNIGICPPPGFEKVVKGMNNRNYKGTSEDEKYRQRCYAESELHGRSDNGMTTKPSLRSIIKQKGLQYGQYIDTRHGVHTQNMRQEQCTLSEDSNNNLKHHNKQSLPICHGRIDSHHLLQASSSLEVRKDKDINSVISIPGLKFSLDGNNAISEDFDGYNDKVRNDANVENYTYDKNAKDNETGELSDKGKEFPISGSSQIGKLREKGMHEGAVNRLNKVNDSVFQNVYLGRNDQLKKVPSAVSSLKLFKCESSSADYCETSGDENTQFSFLTQSPHSSDNERIWNTNEIAKLNGNAESSQMQNQNFERPARYELNDHCDEEIPVNEIMETQDHRGEEPIGSCQFTNEMYRPGASFRPRSPYSSLPPPYRGGPFRPRLPSFSHMEKWSMDPRFLPMCMPPPMHWPPPSSPYQMFGPGPVYGPETAREPPKRPDYIETKASHQMYGKNEGKPLTRFSPPFPPYYIQQRDSHMELTKNSPDEERKNFGTTQKARHSLSLVEYDSSGGSSSEIEPFDIDSLRDTDEEIGLKVNQLAPIPKKLKTDSPDDFSSGDSCDGTQKENRGTVPLNSTATLKLSRGCTKKLKQKTLKSFSGTERQPMCSKVKEDAPKKMIEDQFKKRTLAGIIADSYRSGKSEGRVPVGDTTDRTNQDFRQHDLEQEKPLPPLPPLPPFPNSPFWSMYSTPSSSALVGKSKEYDDDKGKPANSQVLQVQRKWLLKNPSQRYSFSPGQAGGLNSPSETDSESKSTRSDWMTNFKIFHNFGVKYIDTHCHLDFLFSREGFKGSFKAYMDKHSESFPDMFEGCVAVFCNPNTFTPTGGLWLDVAKEPNVWIAMGCHPKMATDFTAAAEMGLKKCLRHTKCIALGEIGLDYSGTFHQHAEVQKQVFRRQLKMALELQKVLVIHCRQAEEDCLEIMKEMIPRNWKIHCHCFTNAYSNAKLWIDAFPNLFIGVTPLVTYKTASPSHDLACNIPINKLLLETDAPYFVPRCIPKDDLPLSNPGLAITVAKEIAQYQELPVAAVLRQCRLNTKFMYGI